MNKLGLLNHMRTVHKKVNSVKDEHLKKNKATEIKNLAARNDVNEKQKKFGSHKSWVYVRVGCVQRERVARA